MQQQDWWQLTFPTGRKTLQIIDANGNPVELSYGEKGQGQPLVCLNGWGCWSYSWHRNIDDLAQHFRVICFDGKGYGYSEKPQQIDRSGYQVKEVIRVIEALSDEPVFLVGESLGGLLALAVAQERPDLVAQLSVIDAAIFPRQMPNLGMRMMVKIPLSWVRFFDYAGLIRYCVPVLRALYHQGQREIYYNPQASQAENVHWVLYPYITFRGALTRLTADSKQATEEIIKLMRYNDGVIAEVQENLSEIKCPTLILWGEKDHWFPPSDAHRLKECLLNSTLVIIPNCGHHAISDCPKEVNQALIEFSKTLSDKPSLQYA
ncbi:alpha/beta fold hydrolase [Beggiatoa leptomitoformis]|uniref:Alpha/beta fold hydrolase n=1 Tax=Beggiatoa leptomitoformis TaxID=288004 RepID=A0A2N9YD86_9GAMM|nr:alpha/beta hydrolase [Beggiatoa leptomitoformis]ALG69157.1 alpha/beta fold hydrolase [Beggiatoa leptomitoformis]AUI68421.1 alpha/beta fold hydrolase [Beggiatoa leptomitoformis]